MLLHVSEWLIANASVHRAEKYLAITGLHKDLNTDLTSVFADKFSFPYTDSS